jgi:hypothetical protein
VIGPNTTQARRTVVFKLVTWFGPKRHAHGLFYIGVAPATTPATGVTTTTTPYVTTPPTPSPSTGRPAPVTTTTTTTAPTSTDNPPVKSDISANWAGYIVEGDAPYTGVRGDFSVPQLSTDDGATDNLAIWVGIDGSSGAGADELIQAGVDESMVPCDGPDAYDTSAYTGDECWICPWTMTIEGGVASVGPVPDLMVSFGDTLEVDIDQDNGPDSSTWTIYMTDKTNGQSWQSDVAYYGPGSTAEWIVEDPGDPNVPCGGTNAQHFMGQCALAATARPSGSPTSACCPAVRWPVGTSAS